MAKSMRIASLAPIDVHLCFCVCETLVFWRRNNESTFGACFLVAIFIDNRVNDSIIYHLLYYLCHFDILPVTPTILTTRG